MKYLLSLLVLLVLATPAFAQTNTNTVASTGVLEAAKQTVATNLNEVIIDMLRGVKVAGGEVYQASKTAIVKSVDFTMEQAPLVVKEFLVIRAVSSVRWLIVWGLVATGFFYLSHRAHGYFLKTREDSDDQALAWGANWILSIIACIILIMSLSLNGMNIAKITLAPRVYLIEYVVDTFNSNQVWQHR